jgi:ElaB/YqjD/DUF883 family membrane-anchored ribosome-binding protein
MKSTQTLNTLIDDVEQLLAELEAEHSPQLDEISRRVEQTLNSAKRAVAAQRESTVKQIKRYAKNVDGYITGFPRLGFLTGILTGIAIAYVTGLTRSD